jgi:hypothetical protein
MFPRGNCFKVCERPLRWKQIAILLQAAIAERYMQTWEQLIGTLQSIGQHLYFVNWWLSDFRDEAAINKFAVTVFPKIGIWLNRFWC